MANLPIFNYLPLENLYRFVEKIDSDEARKLLRSLQGEDGCCWGNPCYNKGCLACFCRGNIKYLTASQAFTQDGLKIEPTKVEYENRKAIIRDAEITDEDWLEYAEHISGSEIG